MPPVILLLYTTAAKVSTLSTVAWQSHLTKPKVKILEELEQEKSSDPGFTNISRSNAVDAHTHHKENDFYIFIVFPMSL